MATGKWTTPGVPQKGWDWVDTINLEDLREICEMCECREIRYVHIMKHTNFAGTIRAGRECAAKMGEDYAGACRREQELKSRSSRKQNWMRREWRVSAAGNDFVNVNGFNIVLIEAPSGWRIRILDTHTDQKQNSAKRYLTKEQAIAGAFDGLLYMEGRRKAVSN